ncbi:Helix-turn-helix domain protein [bacterium YEK0313]|nr:Helix-turn-helix domain protein [bacterium YEK0313]
MSDQLVTVEQAAEQLNLHPKTVLRYIRDGRLAATRVGKSYRIMRAKLDAFAGIAGGTAAADAGVRATCIVDIPGLSVDRAERLATFLHAAALTGDGQTPPLQLQTAFDPLSRIMKVVAIGTPPDVRWLLEMVQLEMSGRS